MYINDLSWPYWCNHTHCLRLVPTETHIPTPEMQNSTPNNTWCRWDVVLCLEYRVFDVVDWCIDIGESMLFGQVYRWLNCWSNSLDWPNPSIHCLWSDISKFDQVFQNLMILLYLYKWECPKAPGPSLYACEEWYETPREVSSTFFRDGIRHDDKCD